MARESPTFAQVMVSESIITPTKVDPLQLTFMSEWVRPFCSFWKTFGRHYWREGCCLISSSMVFPTFLTRYCETR